MERFDSPLGGGVESFSSDSVGIAPLGVDANPNPGVVLGVECADVRREREAEKMATMRKR